MNWINVILLEICSYVQYFYTQINNNHMQKELFHNMFGSSLYKVSGATGPLRGRPWCWCSPRWKLVWHACFMIKDVEIWLSTTRDLFVVSYWRVQPCVCFFLKVDTRWKQCSITCMTKPIHCCTSCVIYRQQCCILSDTFLSSATKPTSYESIAE